jgi:hypothetical protein
VRQDGEKNFFFKKKPAATASWNGNCVAGETGEKKKERKKKKNHPSFVSTPPYYLVRCLVTKTVFRDSFFFLVYTRGYTQTWHTSPSLLGIIAIWKELGNHRKKSPLKWSWESAAKQVCMQCFYLVTAAVGNSATEDSATSCAALHEKLLAAVLKSSWHLTTYTKSNEKNKYG